MASDPPPSDVPPQQVFPLRAAPCSTSDAHKVRLVPAFAWITSSQSSTGSEVRLLVRTGETEPVKNALLSRGSTGDRDEYVVDLRHVDPSAKCELDHSVEAGSLVPKISFVIADLRKKLATGDASGATTAIGLPIDANPPGAPPADSPADPVDLPESGGDVLQTVPDLGAFDDGGQG